MSDDFNEENWYETFGDLNNKVELIGTYGSDTTHALSAWTSTTRDLDTPNSKGVTKRGRVVPLLKMLAENGHHTPFEKSALHFLVTSDIATHIHLLKHRIGVSINGESARYKELKNDKLYMPTEWPESEKRVYLAHMEQTYEHYHRSLKNLTVHYTEKEGMSKRKARSRAKESARFYLPYGNQLTCDIQFNFRSFAHFGRLRYSTHAQREVRDLASKMLEAVRLTGDFDISLKAFGYTDENGNLNPPTEDA